MYIIIRDLVSHEIPTAFLLFGGVRTFWIVMAFTCNRFEPQHEEELEGFLLKLRERKANNTIASPEQFEIRGERSSSSY